METLIKRSWIIEFLILLLYAGIFFRLTILHLSPEPWVIKNIDKKRSFEYRPTGNRGKIFDRNGEILAADVSAYHLILNPNYISKHGNSENVVNVLSSHFKIKKEEISGLLEDTNRKYVRLIKYIPAHKLESFERLRLGLIYHSDESPSINLKGVTLEEAPIRSYPKGSLMSHVIGFSNKEGVGSAGIELKYNSYLKGKEGHRSSKKDGRNREIYTARELDIPPQDGANIILTLDQQIQYIAEKSIENICIDYGAKGACAIVQDVRTGEILAMASFPDFDPNRYGKAPSEWLRNKAISWNFDPGSTIKAAVIAQAIDKGVVKSQDLFDCEKGSWKYAGKILTDHKPQDILSVEDILKVSSNIGTAKIALMMGDEGLYSGLKEFKFGEKLGIELPGEEAGIFPSTKYWSKIKSTRVGIGHGISSTTLQVLSMMSTIANDGFQMKPFIVKQVINNKGETLIENKPELIGRPISRATALKMQYMLARVVSEVDGTGKKASVKGYNVAGKTGTAQQVKPSEEGGGYYKKRYNSSFVGFIPVENPKLCIIVMAEDPGVYTDKGQKIKYTGGTVCGPAFKEIADFSVRYLRISPEGKLVYMNRF